MAIPLVSVIIPAYNHERYIEECVQSIIDQTYSNLELLVIDDGSSDHTWDILQKLMPICKNHFVRIFFDSQKNQGTCVTMNRLIAESRGKYIFDIASDDVIADKKSIEIETDFLEQHPDYVLVVGNCDFIDEQSQRIALDKQQHAVALNTKGAYTVMASSVCHDGLSPFSPEYFGTYQSLLRDKYIPNGYLIRRSVLPREQVFTPEAPMEDWYLMLQLAKAGKMKYIDQILYHYRWHSNNTSKRIYHMQDMQYRTWLYEKKLLKREGRTEYLNLLKQQPCMHPLNYIIRCKLHPFAEKIRRLLHLPSHE